MAIAADLTTLEARSHRDGRNDRLFRLAMGAAAAIVLVVLVGAVLSMAWGGRQALATFGWGFFTSTAWDVGAGQFGALVPVFGTVVTSIIAMVIAVPVSFGIALFLTEVAQQQHRAVVGRQRLQGAGEVAGQALGLGVVRALDVLGDRHLHQGALGALVAVALALDDAEQPGGEGLELAQVHELARHGEQRVLHGVLDVVDLAVVLGVAAQVLARAGEHALERAGIAVARGTQVGGQYRGGHRFLLPQVSIAKAAVRVTGAKRTGRGETVRGDRIFSGVKYS